MGLLKKAENKQAFGKVGIFGFQGTGKTHTAMLIAFGLLKRIGGKAVAFFDTETGSDWWVDRVPKGVDFYVLKSRAFSDLCDYAMECEKEKIPILVADSASHVWRDLMASYLNRINKDRAQKGWSKKNKIEFQDWQVLKGEDGWGKWTDIFINSKLHIIVCGRAGNVYEYDFNEDGSKDLIVTGTKFKAEAEFGYEPSLVIEMKRLSPVKQELERIGEIKDLKKRRDAKQQISVPGGSKFIHRATVLKDRADCLNGHDIDNPTFDSFLPHFEKLNIGGVHLGVDTTRNSEGLFEPEGDGNWKRMQTRKNIAIEKIQGALTELWPGTGKEEKAMKGYMIRTVFETRSWTEVENRPLHELEEKALLLGAFAELYPQMVSGGNIAGEGLADECWNTVQQFEAARKDAVTSEAPDDILV